MSDFDAQPIHMRQNMAAVQFKTLYESLLTLMHEMATNQLPEEVSTQPIIAYRAWWPLLDFYGKPCGLRSFVIPTTWDRGRAAHSPMYRDENGKYWNDAGFHAFSKLYYALNYAIDFYRWKQNSNLTLRMRPTAPIVFGSVALWGTVIEHELGYRAEYAYPQTLYYTKSAHAIVADENMIRTLARCYGCEAAPFPPYPYNAKAMLP